MARPQHRLQLPATVTVVEAGHIKTKVECRCGWSTLGNSRDEVLAAYGRHKREANP